MTLLPHVGVEACLWYRTGLLLLNCRYFSDDSCRWDRRCFGDAADFEIPRQDNGSVYVGRVLFADFRTKKSAQVSFEYIEDELIHHRP